MAHIEPSVKCRIKKERKINKIIEMISGKVGKWEEVSPTFDQYG